jgi:hypothetical protein
MISTFNQFISESDNIKVEKELREYTLSHINDAAFQLKSKNFFKDFSVIPYKKETTDKLKSQFEKLIDAIEKQDVYKLYDVIIKAQSIDYSYGNVFPTKFTLSIIPEIDINLNDDQLAALKSSEREFLLNNFSQLSKDTRTEILDELLTRAEVFACVIEALFYYIRTINKDDFYDGMSIDEIIDTYEKSIKEASKTKSFSFTGPSSNPDMQTDINDESKVAYWFCEKDLKKFIIKGTISIKDLYSEESIGGTKGLKFSIILPGVKMAEKDFNYFNLNELEKRVELFNTKILKKL